DVYHDFATSKRCKMNLAFVVRKLISAVMRPNAKSVPTLNEKRSNGISLTGAVQRQLQSLTNWQTAPAFTVMLMPTDSFRNVNETSEPPWKKSSSGPAKWRSTRQP